MAKKIYVAKEEIAQQQAVDQQFSQLVSQVAKDADSKTIIAKLNDIATKMGKLSPSAPAGDGTVIDISEADYNKLPANKKNDAKIVYMVH